MDAADLITRGNPFAGAQFYVNPDIAKLMDESRAQVAANAELASKIDRVKQQSSAVWMDRIDAITGGAVNGGRLSLRQHLEAASAQQRAAARNGILPPMTAVIVIYNLPDRDCAALASNGTLKSSANGLAIYQRDYIDVIANEFLRFPKLRIVALIEPDSYPNMITNIDTKPQCAEVNRKGVYRDGIRYAIAKLAQIPHVYSYVDIAHSGWLGWDNNRGRAVAGFVDLVRGATPSGRLDVIKGFASNVANYTPVKELYLDGARVRADAFYEYNSLIDELGYIDALQQEFAAAGFTDVSFVIDTARNGWGSPQRPSRATGSVASSKLDLRSHRGNWCNVKNAGIGYFPQATPDASRPYLHAYYWMKPPGESDGTSNSSNTNPNEEGKSFDPMCGSGNVDALPNAPHAGHWFHDQFIMLINNAYPAVGATN
jgi:cellulose 1,4-beta-cellobiosidase